MKSPIFILSLLRAGSTLLQRILMGHKDIASVTEPWFLLPFVDSEVRADGRSDIASNCTWHIYGIILGGNDSAWPISR